MGDIAEILDGSKKHGWPKTLIAIFIVFCIQAALGFFVFQKGRSYEQKQIQKQNQSQSQHLYLPEGAHTGERPSEPKSGQIASAASPKEFSEEDWDIDRNRFLKEVDQAGSPTGFYCVKETKKFDSAEMWFVEKIPVGEGIRIRYALKMDTSVSSSTQSQPQLIFSYATDRIYRLFFPDTDNRFISFEDNADMNASRYSKKRLVRPMDSTQDTALMVGVGAAPPNNAIISYDLVYIGLPVDENDEKKQTSDQDSFSSVFPWTDPTGVGAEQRVGFGTLNGMCIRIIAYEQIPLVEFNN